ncbi:MAG: hypothetical protein AB8B96_05885 [Lysobacterales bacterium]
MKLSDNRLLKPLAIVAVLLLNACASTPEGYTMVATSKAPDTETGAGCNAFGVLEDELLAVPTQKIRFDVQVVGSSEIAEQCSASQENGAVWGCYRKESGKAYIVGKDWKVYWHEWCHAKFGPAHVSLAASGRTPRSYMHYIASNQAP